MQRKCFLNWSYNGREVERVDIFLSGPETPKEGGVYPASYIEIIVDVTLHLRLASTVYITDPLARTKPSRSTFRPLIKEENCTEPTTNFIVEFNINYAHVPKYTNVTYFYI